MPDQYGYAICRSAMAWRCVYPLCLSVKLCVVIFIRSASGVDLDCFVMGSEWRRHEICSGVRGHGPPENFEF